MGQGRPLNARAWLDRLGPFRHRPFVVYWSGGLLSNLGTWLQAVAGAVFVYQLTGSPLAVGVLNFAGFLPILLFSVVGGVISDRFDRRLVILVTHAASLAIAALLSVLALAGSATEIHVIAAAFALNTAYAIAKPSIIALIPSLVPRAELTEAVGLNSLQFITAQILGPTIAAIVLATSGAGPAFAINALTFVGPILVVAYLWRARLGEHAPEPARKAATRPTTGGAVAYVREHRWVVALLAGVVACSAPLEVVRTLSPALVVEGLGEAESTAGIVVAAQSVGSALALLVFVPLRRRGRSWQAAGLGLVLQAVGLLGTAVAPSLAAVAVSVALVGAGFSLCFPVLTGSLQEEVDDSLRGRIMAFHQMAHLGNRPFTALAVGAIATGLGPRLALAAGVVLVPFGLLAARAARRRLGGEERAPVGAEPAGAFD